MPVLDDFKDFPESLLALAPFGPYRGVVKRVVDGDTYDILVDLGFYVYHYIRVRLKGADTPEIFGRTTPEEQAAGQAAKSFAQSLLLEMPVVIWTSKTAETFGRFEARIERGDGQDVAATLIGLGYATPAP